MTQITGKLSTRPFLPKPPRERRRSEDVVATADAVQELNTWARRFHDAVANTLWDLLAKNLVYIVSNSGTAVIGAAETTHAVTFDGRELDAGYRVTTTPSWDTRVWVTGKSVAGFTLNLSAAPGGSGGDVDWSVVR